MTPPALLVVLGASGAGKTAAVRALEAERLPGVRCFFFDDIGVPSPDVMVRDFGGGDGWQAAATAAWVARLLGESGDVLVLEGQTRPSFVRAALARAGADHAARVQIVLLDCTPAERARRLAGPRGQPELASERMDAWAAYLRGQADALELPVVDTTALPVAEVASRLAAEVARLRAGHPRAARA